MLKCHRQCNETGTVGLVIVLTASANMTISLEATSQQLEENLKEIRIMDIRRL